MRAARALAPYGLHVPPSLVSQGAPCASSPTPGSSPCCQPHTNIHGQVHPEVHVLSPSLLHWVLTHHGEDATIQVGLASCLVITGHSDNGGTGAVPGHLVSRPTDGIKTGHRDL